MSAQLQSELTEAEIEELFSPENMQRAIRERDEAFEQLAEYRRQFEKDLAASYGLSPVLIGSPRW